MKDFETKTFSTAEEMKNFFLMQEKSDKWVRVYTKELEAVPLENNELNLYINGAFQRELRNGIVITGFEPEVTEEDIKSSMESTKMSIFLPVANKFRMYPLRYTAFGHIQSRAGITGPSISSLKEKVRAREMAPETRCQIINQCLVLYKDKTLALIRDGKVTALMSGDEHDYSVMETSRLISILENEMASSFKAYEWISGTTSHEITAIQYRMLDNDLQTKITDLLNSYGQLVNNLSVEVQLTTSDVGNCAARLTPIIRDGSKVLPIGKSTFTEHKGGSKAISLFIDNAHTFLARYKDNVMCIETLLKTRINNPGDCLVRVYKDGLKLTGFSSALKECVERIGQEHASGCTAFDIYWYLNEMLYIAEEADKKSGRTVSLFQQIQAQEKIAEVLFMDLKQFD